MVKRSRFICRAMAVDKDVFYAYGLLHAAASTGHRVFTNVDVVLARPDVSYVALGIVCG